MGVYIKGMKMPENCLECINSGFRTAIGCTEWTEICAGLRENHRAISCRLTEVAEPHGRLIDAGKLFRDIEWDDIDNAPTVIEAEVE